MVKKFEPPTSRSFVSIADATKTFYQPKAGPMAPLFIEAAKFLEIAGDKSRSRAERDAALKIADRILSQALNQSLRPSEAVSHLNDFEEFVTFIRSRQACTSHGVKAILAKAEKAVFVRRDSYKLTSPLRDNTTTRQQLAPGLAIKRPIGPRPQCAPPPPPASPSERLEPGAHKLKLKPEVWRDLMADGSPKDQRVGLLVSESGNDIFVTGRIEQSGTMGAGRPVVRVTPIFDDTGQNNARKGAERLYLKEFRMTPPRKLATKSARNSIGHPRTYVSMPEKVDLEVAHLSRFTRISVHGYIKTSNKRYVIIDRMETGNAYEVTKNTSYAQLRVLVRDWLLPLARDIKKMHEQNFVHQDIKSHNFFVDAPERNVVLGDVGMALECANTVPADPLRPLGTFFAPEIYWPKGAAHTGKASDIWCFGLSIIDMLNRGQRNPLLPQNSDKGRYSVTMTRQMHWDFDRWYTSAQGSDGRITARSLGQSTESNFKAFFLAAAAKDEATTVYILNSTLSPDPRSRLHISELVHELATARKTQGYLGRPGDLESAYRAIDVQEPKKAALLVNLSRVAERLKRRLDSSPDHLRTLAALRIEPTNTERV